MTEIIPVAKYKKKTTSEHTLQVVVLAYLLQNGVNNVYAFAIPNAARRSPRMAARMKHEGLRAGVADICIMLSEGKAAWLELKSHKGQQSVKQKGFQARCERLGHPYAVAKTYQHAVAFLEKIGAVK